jgi:hypothetical protein
MSKYKLIQLTNATVGAVAVNEYMPLGTITRRLQATDDCCNTFDVTTSSSDIIYINEPGYYNITYSASVIAGAAGIATLSLIANGVTIYSVGATAATGDTVNLTLPYIARVYKNCPSAPPNCPTSIQILLTGVAITGGTSNLSIEKTF